MDKVTRQCPQTTTFVKRKESLTARPNRLTNRARGETLAFKRKKTRAPRPQRELFAEDDEASVSGLDSRTGHRGLTRCLPVHVTLGLILFERRTT